MRDNIRWSFSLGSVAGVNLRIHALFVVSCVFAVYFSSRDPQEMSLALGFLGLAILFFSLLLHELSHCLIALRLGGTVERIVLVPWGGLAHPHLPYEPQREGLVAVSGRLANFAVVALLAPLFFFLGVGEELYNSLGLMGPAMTGGEALWLSALKLTVWINWLLALVNVLPALPLDCGRVLHAVLWPSFGPRNSVVMISRWFAPFTAFSLMFAAWMTRNDHSSLAVQPWLLLVLAAIYLLFYGWSEIQRQEEPETDEGALGYDFSQGYTSLERQLNVGRPAGGSSFRRWLEDRREAKRQKARKIEQEEERRADEILARLHECGMAGLTPEERAILERVSARYRNRQQH